MSISNDVNNNNKKIVEQWSVCDVT